MESSNLNNLENNLLKVVKQKFKNFKFNFTLNFNLNKKEDENKNLFINKIKKLTKDNVFDFNKEKFKILEKSNKKILKNNDSNINLDFTSYKTINLKEEGKILCFLHFEKINKFKDVLLIALENKRMFLRPILSTSILTEFLYNKTIGLIEELAKTSDLNIFISRSNLYVINLWNFKINLPISTIKLNFNIHYIQSLDYFNSNLFLINRINEISFISLFPNLTLIKNNNKINFNYKISILALYHIKEKYPFNYILLYNGINKVCLYDLLKNEIIKTYKDYGSLINENSLNINKNCLIKYYKEDLFLTISNANLIKLWNMQDEFSVITVYNGAVVPKILFTFIDNKNNFIVINSVKFGLIKIKIETKEMEILFNEDVIESLKLCDSNKFSMISIKKKECLVLENKKSIYKLFAIISAFYK